MYKISHYLQRYFFKVELVTNVVVSRDGLRITVNHDRVVLLTLQFLNTTNATRVKLHRRADPINTGTQDNDTPVRGQRITVP